MGPPSSGRRGAEAAGLGFQDTEDAAWLGGGDWLCLGFVGCNCGWVDSGGSRSGVGFSSSKVRGAGAAGHGISRHKGCCTGGGPNTPFQTHLQTRTHTDPPKAPPPPNAHRPQPPAPNPHQHPSPHPLTPPSPSHVFETVEDDRDARDDKGALDAQIKAITDLLEGLRKQRGSSGGVGVGGAGLDKA